MIRKDDKPIVGWIGTGVMGRWMCAHIMPLASKTIVYNRSAAKTSPLVEAGAIRAESIAELASQADIIFSIVGYPSDVQEIYFGPAGIFENIRPGTIVVDMTTTKPSLATRISTTAIQHGCTALDAPVSGGDVGAREARLSIMAGGDEQTYQTILPFFKAMGKVITLQGVAGSGQHTKMANQIVIAGTMIGVCEALVYAKKAGLNLGKLVETISKGAAGCWTLDNLAGRVLKGDYQPGFMIDHFVKDMGIALEVAEELKLFMPGLALVRQLYVSMQAAGQGMLGTQALVLALERIAQGT